MEEGWVGGDGKRIVKKFRLVRLELLMNGWAKLEWMSEIL